MAISLALAALAGTAPATLASTATAALDHHKSDKMKKADIVDTAIKAGSFNTLVAAVQAAGLEDVLRSDGPFTVFAPTDDAFAALPAGTLDMLLLPENKDKLVAILTYHVVPGKVFAGDLSDGQTAATVNGASVEFDLSDGAMVDDANIIKTDIKTSNGVIHVIDKVLMP